MRQKIAVGMSGGVDSSVAAALLVEQGYEVMGVYIETYNESGCRANEDKKDALKVAVKLEIPFKVLDLRKEYREKVVKYFYDEYRAGRTPNPDVICNQEIKFGLFLDWVRSEGYDKIATGHYARVSKQQTTNGVQHLIQRGIDEGKDQSYFLWKVSPEKLQYVMFPLGEMIKVQVREKAKELELFNWNKPDSMGVCMMGELDVAEKLREKLGEKSGEVIMGGQIVGEHKGLWFSTIGQRVGKEISLQGLTLKAVGVDTTKMPILYVVGKNVEKNQIIIGMKKDGYSASLWLTACSLQIEREEMQRLVEQGKLFVRIRNLGKLIKIKNLESNNNKWEVELVEKVWGVASGQSGVIYDSEGRVVGGGIIV